MHLQALGFISKEFYKFLKHFFGLFFINLILRINYFEILFPCTDNFDKHFIDTIRISVHIYQVVSQIV